MLDSKVECSLEGIRALVLDGEQRAALAVTRALGRKGVAITVGSSEEPCLASRSKFCEKSFMHPSPDKQSWEFRKIIMMEAKRFEKVVLIPITDISIGEIMLIRKELEPAVIVPIAERKKYEAASNKVKVLRMAEEIGISIPKTIFSDEFIEEGRLIEEVEKIGYPIVAKSELSRIRKNNGWVSAGVSYANSREEFLRVLKMNDFRLGRFFLQERIEGPGYGVFCLAKDGEILCHFAHRRIREKPPSGGVSVLCESIEAPHEALQATRRLMERLKWFGVAMVEFKWDNRDDHLKLMEINGRFWGSLQLAISAGVDFPYLLYCMATGMKGEMPTGYKVGIKSRWELGDLDHLLLRLARKNKTLNLYGNILSRKALIKNFIFDFFKPEVRNEILQHDDPRPFWFELKQYLKRLIRDLDGGKMANLN